MTIISGTTIVKAPCCGALLATPAYASINFMAFEYWTDGYDDGILAPKGGGLRRCLCGRCFLLGSTQHVKTIHTSKPRAPEGWQNRKDTWWNRLLGRESLAQILDRYDTRSDAEIDAEQKSIPPHPEYVHDTELLALINSVDIDSDVLQVARRLYWRHLNHPFREVYRAFREAHKDEVDAEGNSATFPEFEPSDEQRGNMEHLVQLQWASDKPNWLELAELYRELGDMGAASRALSNIAGDKARLHLVIDKLVSLNVQGPVKFNY